MSRKHYRQIAAVINDNRRSESAIARLAVAGVARDIADILKRDNPRFRYDKFFEACGLDAFGNGE
jgi:hypothetical protein